MFGSQFAVTAQQLVYDSAHCSVFRKEQSKHVLSNTHRLTLFMYLGMFDVISLINLGFWSEPCTQHILTLWGQLCLFSLKWKCQSLSYVSPPLSRVLVKHVISARACKGCVCVRAHERMCFCVCWCICVCECACTWMRNSHTISQAEALVLLLCWDTWQHMMKQLEQCNWRAWAANSNHISNYILKPYSVTQLIFSTFWLSSKLQNKITTSKWHTVDKYLKTSFPKWKKKCWCPAVFLCAGERRKVITNLVLL